MSTPFADAASKISLPCSARSFLFAVTTHFLAAMASSTSFFAMPVPPIVSTTIPMPSSETTDAASVVSVPSGTDTPRSVVMSRSAIFLSTISTPRRSAMTARCSRRPCATPAPTVPNPRIPTPTSFIFSILLVTKISVYDTMIYLLRQLPLARCRFFS